MKSKAIKEEGEQLKTAYQAADNDHNRATVVEDWDSLDAEHWDE